MKKQVTVYVIYTVIMGKKKYIADTSRNPRNKILVANYSFEAADAHTWNDEAAAKTAISNIHNPHDRVFEIEPLLVAEGKKPNLPLLDKMS